jgi:hypothetical protein
MRTESGGFRVKKWMTFKADTYYSTDVSKLSGILERSVFEVPSLLLPFAEGTCELTKRFSLAGFVSPLTRPLLFGILFCGGTLGGYS